MMLDNPCKQHGIVASESPIYYCLYCIEEKLQFSRSHRVLKRLKQQSQHRSVLGLLYMFCGCLAWIFLGVF